MQVQVRRKFIFDELGREQLRDAQDLRTGYTCFREKKKMGRVSGQEGPGRGVKSGRTEEKCDGVEDVAQDELQSEMVNPEAAANPGK